MKKILCVLTLILTCANVRADETCGTGWTLSSTINSASAVATRGGGCYVGYGIYTGNLGNFRFVPASSTIVCPIGQHMSNGTCVSDSVGNCATGFYDATTNVAAAVQPSGGTCYSGYQAQATNRAVSYLIATAAQTCGSGAYPTANGCASNPTENCPTNFFAPVPSAAIVRAGSNDECPTNYSLYADMDLCRRYLGFNNMPDFCTPQLLCTAGPTTLRTSTGIILPLYGERATTPAINVGFESGTICYVNVLPGAANGTVNMGDGAGNIYHGVE